MEKSQYSEIEPLRKRAILYRLGNLIFKAILSIHGSNQNRILSPFSILKTAKASTLRHCLEIFTQGLFKLEFSLPLVWHWRMLLLWILRTTLLQRELCSTGNLHPHLARRIIFLNVNLSNPRLPSPWDLENKSPFTR